MGFLQKKEARKKVQELSERYGLKVDLDAKVEDITVGMQQRVEILKMLYRDNEILIFDEPTAVLTPQEIDELMHIMQESHQRRASPSSSSPTSSTRSWRWPTACTVLRKGKYIGTVNTKDTNKQELSNMMVGRPVQLQVNKDEAHPGDVVLSVKNFTVPSHLHKKDAVHNVSFDVRAGEIVCIAGIDGNGQTEFIHGLTGLDKSSGGSITVCGHDITHCFHPPPGRVHQPHPGGPPQARPGAGFHAGAESWCSSAIEEPQFQNGGFIKRDAVRELRRTADRAVRRPQRSGRHHHGPQYVRRQPAEGHHRP